MTLCAGAILTAYAACGVRADDYRLGSGDHLRLKISEWRPGCGESYDWSGLSGEFIVGGGGELSLPMLGRIDAAGRTATEVADLISARMQQEIGLVRKLPTSLEVVQHRPFYVAGGVDRPGEYAYRPGITVVEAVSLAGGLYRRPDAENNLERQSILARGAERALVSDRVGLLATQARLQAEVDGAAEIPSPAELAAMKDDPRAAAAVKEQAMLFKSRRESLKSQVDGLDQIKALYAAEIDTLKGKIQSVGRQSTLNKTELDAVDSLMSKGLTTASRKLSLQQNAAQFESARLDLELSVVRAQQAISKADRDKAEAVNARRNETLVEIGQNRAKLNQNDENLATERRLARQAETMLMRRAEDAERPPTQTYEIIRQGAAQPIGAAETDAVMPGDLLRVSEPRMAAAAN
jgi:polysaccharide export outer membrane protein